MKPLYQGFAAGLLVSLLHTLILFQGWTLWDVSIVSISSLSAGVLFILGMIFQSTLQDYKKANISIAQCRGNFLSMQDLNTIAATESIDYNPLPLQKMLVINATMMCAYINNEAEIDDVHTAFTELIPESHEMRKALPGAQSNLFLKQHEDIRQALSYLSFLKNHNFPTVGYVFLSFFAAFIVALQIFSETTNRLLDTLFIFSLSSILVFFITFIRDLDFPFRCHLACFTLDTQPLQDTARILRTQITESAEAEEKNILADLSELEHCLHRVSSKRNCKSIPVRSI